jgi:hypothetical protein
MWPNRTPLERARRYDGVVPIGEDGEPLRPDVIAQVAAITGRPEGFEVVAMCAEGVPPKEYADAGATWLVQSAWPHEGFLDRLRATAKAGPPRLPLPPPG